MTLFKQQKRPVGKPQPRKAPVQQVETIKYKNEPKPLMGYYILNVIFGSLTFVILYLLYIMPRERDIATFALLYALNLASGILGSMVARMFTANYQKLNKTGQQINKALIQSLLFSLILWFGLFGFITARYIDINTMTIAEFLLYLASRAFWEIVAVLAALNALVYLLADFLADKASFGG